MYIDDRPTDQRPTPHFENFKWPYLRNGSSDPLHVWFYGGVFGEGGSNGAISANDMYGQCTFQKQHHSTSLLMRNRLVPKWTTLTFV